MSKSDFFFFEKPGQDFPFYKDEKSKLTVPACIFILVMVGIGFSLNFVPLPIPSWISSFFDIIFPLGALFIVVRQDAFKLFKKIVPRDIITIVGVLFVNLVMSVLVGLMMQSFFGAGANPAVGGMSTSLNIVWDTLSIIPRLIGEELLTLVPFLIVMRFCVYYMKMPRKTSLVLAWVLTAVIFGALHLSTYNWNFAQAIIGIGIARMILTYAYVRTKNVWVSSIVHILNDWILLAPGILAGFAAMN